MTLVVLDKHLLFLTSTTKLFLGLWGKHSLQWKIRKLPWLYFFNLSYKKKGITWLHIEKLVCLSWQNLSGMLIYKTLEAVAIFLFKPFSTWQIWWLSSSSVSFNHLQNLKDALSVYRMTNIWRWWTTWKRIQILKSSMNPQLTSLYRKTWNCLLDWQLDVQIKSRQLTLCSS